MLFRSALHSHGSAQLLVVDAMFCEVRRGDDGGAPPPAPAPRVAGATRRTLRYETPAIPGVNDAGRTSGGMADYGRHVVDHADVVRARISMVPRMSTMPKGSGWKTSMVTRVSMNRGRYQGLHPFDVTRFAIDYQKIKIKCSLPLQRPRSTYTSI